MASQITAIEAEEILDSRGNPTILARVFVDKISSALRTMFDPRLGADFYRRGVSFCGEFAVPSGASTGSFEAHELRDKDPKEFNGKGVKKAIQNIKEIIAPRLIGLDAEKQSEIDRIMIELDGTSDKSLLGANAIISVSIAVAKAAAQSKKYEPYEYLGELADIKHTQLVPFLFMNLINGGKHAASSLAFQEYHVVPQTDDIEEALEMATVIDQRLKEMIITEFGASSANLGDEGGFALDINDVRKPLELLWQAVEKTGHTDRIKLALDVAASSFFKDGKYLVGKNEMSADELLAMYQGFAKDFPIVSIEDPFEENAFDDFARLLVSGTRVVGDDLTVTNKTRLKEAIDKKSIDIILIKLNQIGTLTETLETMELARDNDIDCIISHRSGETNDDFIADLAFAFGCFGLKAGAPQRGERVAKYNRLKHITAKI